MNRREEARRQARAQFKKLRGRSLPEENDDRPWLKVVVPGGVDGTVARMNAIYRKFLDYMTQSSFWRGQFALQAKLYKASKFPFAEDLNPHVADQLMLFGSRFCDLHPLDAFLDDHASEFSSAGKKQLLRWKQSQFGVFECGPQLGATFLFRPWDLLTNEPAGDWFHAHLNYESSANPLKFVGQIIAGHLCPWAPEYHVQAFVGLPSNRPKSHASVFASLLGLRDVEFAQSPWPWDASDATRRAARLEWANREWRSWLFARLERPFDAICSIKRATPKLRILQLLPNLDESDTLTLGAHAVCEKEGLEFPWPLEQLYPVNPFSPEAEAIAEYRDFMNLGRAEAGSAPTPKSIAVQNEVERRYCEWKGIEAAPPTDVAESA